MKELKEANESLSKILKEDYGIEDKDLIRTIEEERAILDRIIQRQKEIMDRSNQRHERFMEAMSRIDDTLDKFKK